MWREVAGDILPPRREISDSCSVFLPIFAGSEDRLVSLAHLWSGVLVRNPIWCCSCSYSGPGGVFSASTGLFLGAFLCLRKVL